MIQMLIHRVVHSRPHRVVHNLIEQTQSTKLPSVPQTTKLTLTQLSALRTMLSGKPKWDSVDDLHPWATMLQPGQSICIQRELHYNHSNNFPARRTTIDSWLFLHNFPQMSLSYPKNTQTFCLLKLSNTKSEITITGSNGQRPANHHRFCLLMGEPRVSLQHQELIATNPHSAIPSFEEAKEV